MKNVAFVKMRNMQLMQQEFLVFEWSQMVTKSDKKIKIRKNMYAKKCFKKSCKKGKNTKQMQKRQMGVYVES